MAAPPPREPLRGCLEDVVAPLVRFHVEVRCDDHQSSAAVAEFRRFLQLIQVDTGEPNGVVQVQGGEDKVEPLDSEMLLK